MKLLALCMAFLISFQPFFIHKTKVEIIAGPYVQNVSKDSITIMWATNVNTTNNRVYWGLEKLDNITECNENRRWHEVKINGLKQSSKYFYMVESDGVRSKIYSFHSLPYKNESFSFIVYGDTRGVWDGWKNASKIAMAIEKEKPEIVIHVGDIVRDGANEQQWIKFFQISTWIHNATFYPAIGNHDLPYALFKKYFSLPGNEQWYSFDYGSIHFTILDSNSPLSISQFLWLLHDLKKEAKWKIVVFHHPLFSSIYINPLLWIWHIIFQLANVDFIFNGHCHNYEHIKIGDINYVITGGGGASLHPVGKSKWTVCSKSTYHYCKILASFNALNFTSYDVNGSTIEQFVIEK